MSVIDFRPHRFKYRMQGVMQRAVRNECGMLTEGNSIVLESTKGYVDENGDYVSAKSSFSPYYRCNAVPNGGNATVKNAEGRSIEYSFTIYADKSIKDFVYGELIQLDRCGILYELTVKGFHRYRGFAKIWV